MECEDFRGTSARNGRDNCNSEPTRIGLGELGRRMFKWRVAPAWWVIALSPLLLALVVMGGVGIVTGQPVSIADLGRADFLPDLGLVAMLFWILTFGIGEETGWRGLALPRLQQKRSPLAATAVLWVFWTLWHLPAFFLPV